MPINTVTPKQVHEAVHRGRKRLRNFRNARLMFLRNYVGQYYDRESGDIGTEALNLIFNAIRSLVPHIVMSFPTHKVHTPYLMQREYGELLGLALEQHDRKIDIKSVYRRWIVDAIFAVGVVKTGLATSDSIYAFDEYDTVDSGEVYSMPVDFDNLIVDPNSKEHHFIDAAFIGDMMTVPRKLLLDSGLYRNDLIEQLPRVGDRENDKAYQLSMRSINSEENFELEDEVSIIELWVPSADAVIWLPGDEHVSFDDYLRISDHYGVKEGPYTFLSLTPPVPGNPLPVPMVGIWNDLHILANKMAKKIVDQALRQKDIVVYRRAAADDAEELRDAQDGETVATDDPDGVQIKSFGGQQHSNEVHLAQLQAWFNMMAGNPDMLSGAKQAADTATQETILNRNASVSLDDMKDMVYAAAAAESRKRAWYFDADPLMEIPLIRRRPSPAQFIQTPAGPVMTQPPQLIEEQIILSPELRRGDFLDFMFTIEPESMGRRDSKTRFAQAMDFCVKVMPAVASAAQTFMMLGLPFSAKAMMIRMAKDSGIDWLDEIFYDPEFQLLMAQRMMMGPQQEKGQFAPQQQPNAGLMGGPAAEAGGDLMAQILQNGQPSSVMSGLPSPQTEMASSFQAGANQGQSELKRGY